MAESEQSPPQSDTPPARTPTPTPSKFSGASFSIWPPTEKTRDAVRNRLIETLSSQSLLSKRYGTISHDEAVDVAKRIEDEAFDAASSAAIADDDGIEILQVYSKEISKRMLDTVKSRSGEPGTTAVREAEAQPAVDLSEPGAKSEEVDDGSNAPPQSEKTDSVTGNE